MNHSRLRELDFLRGIAIILVLFRHGNVWDFTTNMGWIGVDLFFVLSGYLVSGLLFREYLKYGSIRPGRFLIRRGFKIYPIYYLFYIAYLIPLLPTLSQGINVKGFISDMLFMQNYVWGWGWAFAASWSLAIEEHFYFGLSFFLWLGVRLHPEKTVRNLPKIIVALMAICLVLRIVTVYMMLRGTPDFSITELRGDSLVRGITMTHLRIDSLLVGVLISYFYHFRMEKLLSVAKIDKKILIGIVLLFLSFTPFSNVLTSIFIKTIGFTLVYLAFGIVLILFIVDKKINDKLDRIVSRPLANAISRIGFCSYSIYVIHMLMNSLVHKLSLNHYMAFLISTSLSIGAGMLMTYYIEQYFLKIRDRHFPSTKGKPEGRQVTIELPVPVSRKKNGLMLDLNTSDGLSLIVASKKKYIPIGMAKNIGDATQCLVNIRNAKTPGYVIVANLQGLPFQPQLFDFIWSSKCCALNTEESFRLFTKRISEVMAKSGRLKIRFENSDAINENSQMNNVKGLNGYAHHFKYPFHQKAFQKHLVNVHTSIDTEGLRNRSTTHKSLKTPSSTMAKLSHVIPALNHFAQSVFITARKSTGSPNFRIHHFMKHHWMNDNLNVVYLLQCPISGGPVYLSKDSDFVISDLANVKYPIVNDIPIMLREAALDLHSNKTAVEAIRTLQA